MKWPVSTISRVCLPTDQRDPTQTPETLFRYIDIAAVDKELKRILAAPEIMGCEAPSRARKVVRAGDVVVSTVRPNLNAVALVPEELDGQIASTGFCVLRGNPYLADGRFLFYRCQSVDFITSLVARMRGANYPAVSDSVVKQTAVPVPALREQRRIVELLEQADGLRRKRTEADALAERILPVVFQDLFGGSTHPASRSLPLGTFLKSIDSGWSPTCENRQASDDEWGVLKLGAVSTNHYLSGENKALPSTLAPDQSIQVVDGDLLFSRKNTLELVGACAYVFKTRPRLMLSDLIFRLRFLPDAPLEPLYVWGLLTQPGMRLPIKALAGGSAGSMPNISKSRLETLPIPVPSIGLQRRFVEVARQLNAHWQEIGQAREQLDRLFGVMLHRAFTGELTAKWREGCMKELLAEMETQASLLGVTATTHEMTRA